jgi:hypothetical protein
VLHAVVQEGDMVELLRLLNQRDEDININQTNHMGLTALHHSVLTNNMDATKLLLCQGADVDIQDANGFSPLHAAAGCDFLYICSMLVVFGADTFLQNNDGDYPVDLCKDQTVAGFLFEEMCRQIHQRTYWRHWCIFQLKELWFFLKYKFKHFVVLFGIFLKYSTEECTKTGHYIYERYILGSIGPPQEAGDKTN